MSPYEQMKEPESQNGRSDVTKLDEEHQAVDRRILYFVVGGILIAFTFGLLILVISALTDWQ